MCVFLHLLLQKVLVTRCIDLIYSFVLCKWNCLTPCAAIVWGFCRVVQTNWKWERDHNFQMNWRKDDDGEKDVKKDVKKEEEKYINKTKTKAKRLQLQNYNVFQVTASATLSWFTHSVTKELHTRFEYLFICRRRCIASSHYYLCLSRCVCVHSKRFIFWWKTMNMNY